MHKLNVLLLSVVCVLGLGSASAAVRFGDRMVPIDPLLDEVDLARPTMTFFWNGDDPMPGQPVSVKIDGKVDLSANLGEDRQVKFDLGKLSKGEHQLSVAFAGGTWDYTITVRPPVDEKIGKKLNNFVRELVNAPLRDGVYKFTLQREGWVFIGFNYPSAHAQAFLDGAAEPVVTFRADEPSETMRYVKEGEHVLKIKGAVSGRLFVRQVKDLKSTCKVFYKHETALCSGKTHSDYGFDFIRRWIFPSYNWAGVGGGWKTHTDDERFVFGNREAAVRGKRLMAKTGKGGSDREDRANFEKMRGYMCEKPAYRDEGVALEYDEHRVNAPRAEMDAFAEACWEMVAKRDDRPFAADYMDMPSNFLTNPVAQVSSLAAIINTGRGRGMIVPEMYLGAQRTMPEILRQDEVALRYVESLRKVIPSAPSRIIHLMSGWLTIGDWSNYCSCECDFRVVVDRYLQRLATDPVYADVGGIGMSTLACDEEMARWIAAAIHHYCIDGQTNSLAEACGLELFPKYMANGDFMEELKGWTVTPAEGGSIVHERKENYGGKRGQARMMRYNTQCGEHFAVMMRSAKAPNWLSQTVRGLVPGDYYTLTFAFSDYDDAMKPGSVAPDFIFNASLTDAEIVEDLSFETDRQRKGNGHTVVRRVVFKARASTSELTFSDWKSATEPGGEAGRKHLVNFISVKRYFVKDQAELEALKALSGKPGVQPAPKAKAKKPMMWGLMLQLGHNMWSERCPSNRTDYAVWKEVTEYAAKKGVNTILIDCGEGMVYPSHPELAVEGSWDPARMKTELDRLRGLGLTPIPKVNFSSLHSAWMGPYRLMISSPAYYRVVSDIIKDVYTIFEKPEFIHLGWDEERLNCFKNREYACSRQGELWWHDCLFTIKEVEKLGARAWIWSDKVWVDHDEFVKRMPHSVMQSNWHYFFLQNMVRNDEKINSLDWPEAWAGPLGFLDIDDAGYENIPCVSNYMQPRNYEVVVRFAKEHLNREKIRGFMMAPWQRTYGEKCRKTLLEACDLTENAIKVWNDDEHQVVIYGATPAGIAAAIAARRAGKEPILLEPSPKVGGLTTGGLGQTDIGNKAAFGGIARKFYQDIKAYYEKDAAWKFQKRTEYRPKGQSVWARGEDAMWTFEPSAAESVLDFWLRDWKIKTYLNARLDRGPGGVVKEGRRIVSIRLEDGRVFKARQFIDATYEGDLMAAAGVSYTVGREGNDVYGETISGVQRALMKNHQIVPGVDPYVVKGDPKSGLLPGIAPDTDEPDGAGDKRVQAYCYRMCLTDDPRNRIPFVKPEGYNPLDYELLLRNFEAGEKVIPWINSPMPNRKTDTNNRTGVSTDFIGANWNYPESSYAEREEIAKAHLKYQQGLMWTLANNPRVPEAIRKEVARWGTCKDEFVGERGNGWQYQLYVREARRMIGEYVMTEHECRGERKVPRPVAMGAYGMDSHNVRRYVGKDGFAHNEGNIEDYSANGPGNIYRRFAPFSIDYGALVPKRGECSNLFVPVCLSASHMAFGSIRMEPAFFALGEVAGMAAAMALEADCAVQDVNYAELRKSLLARKQVIESTVKLPKLDPMPDQISVGLIVRRLTAPEIPDRQIIFGTNAKLPSGAYRLVVDATDVYIFSSDESGKTRARQTLMQLVTEDGQGAWQIPCVEIIDGCR